MNVIGIRKEDKNEWERRVPIIPDQVCLLLDEHSIVTRIQTSPNRAVSAEEFRSAGAEFTEDIPDAPVIFAVKEIPMNQLREGTTYVFFSHVIKGQEYNMPLLRRLMELRCNLIDYEKITDSSGRRLVFFGKEAGQAGMIDTLWALGRRLRYEEIPTPLSEIRKTVQYDGLEDSRTHLEKIAEHIRSCGLPREICPIIVGFAGYGNVSQGAQEVFDILPHEEIAPDQVEHFKEEGNYSRKLIYKVVFREEHMVELNDPHPEEGVAEGVGREFDLQDYYHRPEANHGVFGKYVPHITVLMNCIYWDARYPRLVTKARIKDIYLEHEHPTFRVVGDISCDYEGSIEATIHSTESGQPTFVYDPFTDTINEEGEGPGLTIMAVDNLPAELPREASTRFSRSLFPFINSISSADYSVPFESLDMVPEVKRALILYQGELTPDYQYLEEFLKSPDDER